MKGGRGATAKPGKRGPPPESSLGPALGAPSTRPHWRAGVRTESEGPGVQGLAPSRRSLEICLLGGGGRRSGTALGSSWPGNPKSKSILNGVSVADCHEPTVTLSRAPAPPPSPS